MGNPPILQRGRMPVFNYLTEAEAADVYLYLTTYPPQSSSGDSFSPAESSGAAPPNRAYDSFPAATRPLKEAVDGRSILLMVGLGAVVMLLIVAGFLISAWELIRLSARSAENRWPTPEAVNPAHMQFYATSKQETYSCEGIDRAS
jgi:hypothetical protein